MFHLNILGAATRVKSITVVNAELVLKEKRLWKVLMKPFMLEIAYAIIRIVEILSSKQVSTLELSVTKRNYGIYQI